MCVCVEKVDVVWDTVLVPVVMYQCVTWTTTSYLCARIVASDTSAHRIILRRMFCCLVNRGTTGVNSLPKTVTRHRHDCDLNPGPSAPESSTLTTQLPSHLIIIMITAVTIIPVKAFAKDYVITGVGLSVRLSVTMITK